jgi:hypothetical protein
MAKFMLTYDKTVEEEIEAKDVQAAIDNSDFNDNYCYTESLKVKNDKSEIVYDGSQDSQ